MKRPFGVVFSAVLLILGSLLELLMAFGMALSEVYIQAQIRSGGLPGSRPTPPMPGWMPFFTYAICVFLVALAAWGILTAVGLFKLRRWARYSVLILGGGLALVGLISCLATLAMLAVPLPLAPGVDASQAQAAQAMVKVVFAVIGFLYALLCAVGVSWLVYFNRKKVRELFRGAAGSAPASRRPFPISLIAVFSMIGAVFCLLTLFLPFPGLFFGWTVHGWAKAALYLILGALSAAVGVGLWRLEEWGRRLSMGLLALWLVQSVVYLARPSLIARYTEEVNRIMNVAQPLPPQFQNTMYIASFGFSVLWIAAIALVLFHYRAAFERPAEPPQGELSPSA